MTMYFKKLFIVFYFIICACCIFACDPSISKSENIIKEIEIENYQPVSIITSKVNKNGTLSNLAVANAELLILTNNEGNSWNMNTGDCFDFTFEKEESHIKNQQIIIGYIHDGTLTDGEVYASLTGNYIYTVEEEGTYYLYIIGASSDDVLLKDCNLKITD